MNKLDVKEMLSAVNSEMSKIDDQIRSLTVKHEQLTVVKTNLEFFSNGVGSVTERVPDNEPAKVEEEDVWKPKRKITPAGMRAIRLAQKRRREREAFEKLGKTPLKTAKNESRKAVLHWTQTPRGRAFMKKTAASRFANRKAA